MQLICAALWTSDHSTPNLTGQWQVASRQGGDAIDAPRTLSQGRHSGLVPTGWCRSAIGSRAVLTGYGHAISEAGSSSLKTRGCLDGAGRWQVPSKAVHAPRLPHAAGTPRHMLVQSRRPRRLLTQARATHPMLHLHQIQ